MLWYPENTSTIKHFHLHFYKCCESGISCLGFPYDFAPWDCLQNPLWPTCEHMERQCEAEERCSQNYHTVSTECLGMVGSSRYYLVDKNTVLK